MMRMQTLIVGLCLALSPLGMAQDSKKTQEEQKGKETPAKQSEPKYLAITGADVYVGTGQLMRRATILIADDKIKEVGPGIDLPEGTTILDAEGKVCCPGFVIVKAPNIGGVSLRAGEAKDSCNPFDPQIKLALSAGITAYITQASGGSGLPSGKSAVIKMAFGDLDGMVVQEGTVQSMRVPLSMAKMQALRDAIKKAKEYQKELEEYQAKAAEEGDKGKGKASKEDKGDKDAKKKGSKKPKAPKGAEDLLKIMDGEAKLWISCRATYDNDRIRQALAIAKMLGRGVILDSPLTAWSMAGEVAASGSMAIIQPRQQMEADPARPDSTGSNMAMARILDAVGVPVAVTPSRSMMGGPTLGTGGILGHDLNTPHMDAAFAVRGGLDNHKALRTITLDAAAICGVEARLGSIEEGKDADILILDGDPLHYKTFVQTAIVNGKVVYEKAKEPFYGHIKRQTR